MFIMKKLTYLSGSFFSSMTVLSVLFKLLQLQGASELLSVGLLGIALVFIPTFTKYHYDRSDH
jgi:hypothetical protein